jgi:hypothetical protein
VEDRPAWDEITKFEGRYANCFQVGYNAFEFLMDFGQISPETSQRQLHSRIITNPGAAKAFWITLGRSLQQYQTAYGVIPDEPEE